MSDYPYMDEFEYIDYCISNSKSLPKTEDNTKRQAILSSGNSEELRALILKDNRINPNRVNDDLEHISDQQFLYELACEGVADAVWKIKDQQLLYDYYRKEDYVYYKKRAVSMMTDQDNLLTIAKSWESLEIAEQAKRSLDQEHMSMYFEWINGINARIRELEQMDTTETAKFILTEDNWKVREWIAKNISLPPEIVEKFEKCERCKRVRTELLYSSKDYNTLRIMARLDDDLYIRRNAEEWAEYWREKNNPYE